MNMPALARSKTTFRRMSFVDGDFAKLRQHHNFLFVGDMVGVVAELDGEIIGAGMFDTFQNTSCWAHLWVANPVAFHDGLLEECCMLAYVEMDINKVLLRLIESNDKIVASAIRGGFKLLFRVEDGADFGDDYLFYELKRQDCAYLPEEFRR